MIKDMIKDIWGRFKKLFYSKPLIAIFAVLVVLTIALIVARVGAKGVGTGVGTAAGTIVGGATGSIEGVTVGLSEGSVAGTEDGLSAADTTAEIKETLESVANLEVLVAGVTVENVNKIGDTYKALYLIDGDAVFTVDLSEAEIIHSEDGSTIDILLPELETQLYLDQSSTEKLAEVQNFSLSVSAEDGLTSYLNSMSQVAEKAEENIANYDDLKAMAESSAIDQVELLVSELCASGQTVNVQFKQGE